MTDVDVLCLKPSRKERVFSFEQHWLLRKEGHLSVANNINIENACVIIYFADLNPSRIIPIDINIPFPLATSSFRKCNYGKFDIVFRARQFLSCRVIVLVRSDTWSVNPTVQLLLVA